MAESQQQQEQLIHNDNEEVIQIVDINNNPIGKATRQEMRDKQLIHRCTYIFLENEQTNKLYVHKRTMLKKWCPGYYDLAFGGVVQYQESYEDNAQRELLEEAGVNEKLVPLFTFFFNQTPSVPTWGKVFYAKTSQNLQLQKEEVESVSEMSVQEIQNMIQNNNNVAYDSKAAFELFIQKYQEYQDLIQKELKN